MEATLTILLVSILIWCRFLDWLVRLDLCCLRTRVECAGLSQNAPCSCQYWAWDTEGWGRSLPQFPAETVVNLGNFANIEIVEGNDGGLAESEPLLHSGYDKQRILFLQALLIRKEALAVLHFFFDRPRDLALSVFEVCFVDLDALSERAFFFPCLFLGVPLSELSASRFIPLKGFQRILFWLCVEQDAYCLGVLDLVVVWVVDVFFFLEVRPAPLVPFFANSPGTLSFPPFSNFQFFFILFCFLGIAAATCCVINLPINFSSVDISPSRSMSVSSTDLLTSWPFSSLDIWSSNSL